MKRSSLLAITFLALIGLLGAACGSMAEDKKGQVADRMDEVWRAGGVDPQAAQLVSYDFTKRPADPACRGLENEGDHWFAVRRAVLPAGVARQMHLIRRMERRLSQQGFQVSRYRSVAAHSRGLKARSREKLIAVDLVVDRSGRATMQVTSTPCAGMVSMNPDRSFVPDASS